MSQWKRQLLDGANARFIWDKKSKAREAELLHQIGRQHMELKWLKQGLSCSAPRELRKLFDQDHPELSIGRQCALLSLPRSSPHYHSTAVRESTLRIMGRIDALCLVDINRSRQ